MLLGTCFIKRFIYLIAYITINCISEPCVCSLDLRINFTVRIFWKLVTPIVTQYIPLPPFTARWHFYKGTINNHKTKLEPNNIITFFLPLTWRVAYNTDSPHPMPPYRGLLSVAQLGLPPTYLCKHNKYFFPETALSCKCRFKICFNSR